MTRRLSRGETPRALRGWPRATALAPAAAGGSCRRLAPRTAPACPEPAGPAAPPALGGSSRGPRARKRPAVMRTADGMADVVVLEELARGLHPRIRIEQLTLRPDVERSDEHDDRREGDEHGDCHPPAEDLAQPARTDGHGSERYVESDSAARWPAPRTTSSRPDGLAAVGGRSRPAHVRCRLAGSPRRDGVDVR